MTIFLTSWGWAIFPLLSIPIKNLKKTFSKKEFQTKEFSNIDKGIRNG